MNTLNDRFLAFLDEEKPVVSHRVFWAQLALALGAVVMGGGVWVLLALRLGLVGGPMLSLGLWMLGWGAWQLVENRRGRWLAHRVREIVSRGQRVNAYLVRAPDRLYRPGSVPQTCQVLISFQPEVSGERDYMLYLAQRWAEQTTGRERTARYRRVRLPEPLTDGSTVYCCDLHVHPGLLAAGYLTGSVLPCVAEFGDTGGIELVPYWLLFPYVETPIHQRQRV